MKRNQLVLNWIWYGNSWLCYVLWPLSLIYRFIAYLKRIVTNPYRFNVPVIVVGNISVGGTGKTPLCIAVCEQLKQQGMRPGLVSRGYGGKAINWPQTVTVDSDPKQVGDEPLLLVQRTGCPMVVAPDRVAAVKQLLNDFDCDVVVSDDGLQHYRLQRDLEIVVIDEIRGVGNSMCLPAGPLREPVSRLKSADMVIKERKLKLDRIYNIIDPAIWLPEVTDKKVIAIAGIGHPQQFFDLLIQQGIHCKTIAFSDHYAFKPDDITSINADFILMTEKDAVKCKLFNDQRCYAVKISVVLSKQLVTLLSSLSSDPTRG